ncbi:MAG: AMP-binding protein [Gammaproteobacteria bacterium]|nr:AMP-binding protein [Gammaproteobacteria bacterium]
MKDNDYNMQDYQATYSSFQWERPEKYNFVRDVLDHWQPSKPALLRVDDDGVEITRTFGEISVASKRLCNVLTDAGVKAGDTVIVMLPRVLPWWETFTAVLRMGAVISPGTVQLSEKDLEYRINAANATCVVTDRANAAKVDAVLDRCPPLLARVVTDGQRDGWIDYGEAVAAASPDFETVDTGADDDAICYFTSGTTGYPKLCIHTHSYAIGHRITGEMWLDLKPEDLHWNLSDTGWGKAAYSSYFGPWLCGTTLFIHHSSGFNPRQTLELLEKYPVTTFCGAPTIYRMLVLEDLSRYCFDTLRHCAGAGEPLNPEIIETWKKATGLTIRDGYGQTESVILCASFPCIEPRPGSMGKPAPGIDLQVIDDAGAIVAADQEGDIAMRIRPQPPQGFFREYRNDPERTAATRRGDWYVTGDRAYRDEDGYFWFVSRADDVILSAGYRIGPFEVESALIEHPAVAESAVVSSPDATRGEVVKAFVVLAPGYQASEELKRELQDHVKQVTAPYKYPRQLEFTTALPKTVSGKIRRVELREREWKNHA